MPLVLSIKYPFTFWGPNVCLLLAFSNLNDCFRNEELRLREAMRLIAEHVAGPLEGRVGSL